MSTRYEVRYASSPQAVKQQDISQLRDEFLVDNLMTTDEVVLIYSHYDRYIAGSAVPVKGDLSLEAIDPLKAENFLDRRELEVINVGGAGVITIDGEAFELSYKDALYVAMGSKQVVFSSKYASQPAKLYLNSAPAHHRFITRKMTKEQGNKIETEVGAIDILVNNAGIIKRTPIVDMEVVYFELVVKVDLLGLFIVSKNVAKGMIKRNGGKIINICSMMSELGRDSVSAYAAAKGDLKILTRNMATEWAKHNIQTNGIGPGYFATSQTASITSGWASIQ